MSWPSLTPSIASERNWRWTAARASAAAAAGSGRPAVCGSLAPGVTPRETLDFVKKKLRKGQVRFTMRVFPSPTEMLFPSTVGGRGLLQGDLLMAIRVTCPACHSSYSVSDDLRGK